MHGTVNIAIRLFLSLKWNVTNLLNNLFLHYPMYNKYNVQLNNFKQWLRFSYYINIGFVNVSSYNRHNLCHTCTVKRHCKSLKRLSPIKCSLNDIMFCYEFCAALSVHWNIPDIIHLSVHSPLFEYACTCMLDDNF